MYIQVHTHHISHDICWLSWLNERWCIYPPLVLYIQVIPSTYPNIYNCWLNPIIQHQWLNPSTSQAAPIGAVRRLQKGFSGLLWYSGQPAPTPTGSAALAERQPKRGHSASASAETARTGKTTATSASAPRAG